MVTINTNGYLLAVPLFVACCWVNPNNAIPYRTLQQIREQMDQRLGVRGEKSAMNVANRMIEQPDLGVDKKPTLSGGGKKWRKLRHPRSPQNYNKNVNINVNSFGPVKIGRIREKQRQIVVPPTTMPIRHTTEMELLMDTLIEPHDKNCTDSHHADDRLSSSFIADSFAPKDLNTSESDSLATIEVNTKKTTSVHVGEDVTLCWIETTTIKEDRSCLPVKRLVIREYTITFENAAAIPSKYLECDQYDGEVDDGVPKSALFEVIDENTRHSRVVNFTTISHSGNSTIWRHKRVTCGMGPIVTKNVIEWTDDSSDNPKTRLEIKVSPKTHNLTANPANLDNCTTNPADLQPTSTTPAYSAITEDCGPGTTCDCVDGYCGNYTEPVTDTTVLHLVTAETPSMMKIEDDAGSTEVLSASSTTVAPPTTQEEEDHLSDVTSTETTIFGTVFSTESTSIESVTLTVQPGTDPLEVGNHELESTSEEPIYTTIDIEESTTEIGARSTEVTESSDVTDVTDGTFLPFQTTESSVESTTSMYCNSSSGDCVASTVTPSSSAGTATDITEWEVTTETEVSQKYEVTNATTEFGEETTHVEVTTGMSDAFDESTTSNSQSISIKTTTLISSTDLTDIPSTPEAGYTMEETTALGDGLTTGEPSTGISEVITEITTLLITSSTGEIMPEGTTSSTELNGGSTIKETTTGVADTITEMTTLSTISGAESSVEESTTEIRDATLEISTLSTALNNELTTKETPAEITTMSISLGSESTMRETTTKTSDATTDLTTLLTSLGTGLIAERTTIEVSSRSTEETTFLTKFGDEVTTEEITSTPDKIETSITESEAKVFTTDKVTGSSTELDRETSTPGVDDTTGTDISMTTDESVVETTTNSTSEPTSIKPTDDITETITVEVSIESSTDAITPSPTDETTYQPSTMISTPIDVEEISTTLDDISESSEATTIEITTEVSKPKHKLALKLVLLLEHVDENNNTEKLIDVEKHLLFNEQPNYHRDASLMEQIRALNFSINMHTVQELLNCSIVEKLSGDFGNFAAQYLINETKNPGNPAGIHARRTRDLSSSMKRELDQNVEMFLPGIHADIHSGLSHVMARVRDSENKVNRWNAQGSPRPRILEVVTNTRDGHLHERMKRQTLEDLMIDEEDMPKDVAEVGQWSNERVKRALNGGQIRSFTEFTIYKDS